MPAVLERLRWLRVQLYRFGNSQWFWIGIVLPISILFVAFAGGRSLESNYNIPQGVTAPVIAGVFAILVAVLQLKPNTKQKEEEIAVKKAEIELTHLKSTTSAKCQQIETEEALLQKKKEFVSELVKFGLELEISKPDELIGKVEQILDYYKQAHAYDALDIAEILEVMSKDIKSRISSRTEVIKQFTNLIKSLSRSLDHQIDNLNVQLAELHSNSEMTAQSVLNTLSNQQQLSPSADLHRKNLSGMNLSGKILRGANLSGKILRGANLSGANLYGANLSGANLSGANLYRANLYGANLSGANLSGAYLSGAFLSGAYLSGASLYGADLEGAYLSRANLSGAYLDGANLSGANLEGADLSGADLGGADLEGAKLSRADLEGAKGLVPEQIFEITKGWQQAYYDEAFRQKLCLPPS
ncbi:pentapeptide repeat-containing protein [Cyanobacteria bacterium FACHB-63]|nr:pentapeptide repeat-containing protein [Cyanobacteria bacterium FACHB-63]